ncbi:MULTISPECIES: colicin immunity domain-containing protein [Serratia]|uniref:Colicin immunity protein n=1 Tax=Serratia marcescens TaxID=615 RepID=A0A379ZWM0_SERMA|nr:MULTISPECIES: colicin immunity domain-containing protein [Serratia]AIM21526.1 colicin-D immunity protein [Serratia sp. SCBI]ASM30713.1 colicin immunity protein [Serratia marcescens]EMB4109697.1 colicin immunity protein [Serratia marcescens]KFL02931.1 bacterial self-protective colicin-like immunity family protein [Serratia marcescens]MBS7518453.1 colicin immunity protein [Serratia ureilytica]
MSMKLIEIAQALLDSKLTADEYESQYLNVWRKERDDGTLRNDSNDVGYCAAELFSLADCYTSSPNRDGSDLDENELKIEVKKTLEKYNFLKKE